MFGRHRKPQDNRGESTTGTDTATFSPQQIQEALARAPMFSQLGTHEQRALASFGVQRRYEAGVHLVQQGEVGVGLYVLLQGTVRVTQRGSDGAVRELATLGPGRIFGEMALLDQRPRSATVTAVEPTIALVIPIWDFRAAVKDNGDAAMQLLSLLTQRVREAEVAGM